MPGDVVSIAFDLSWADTVGWAQMERVRDGGTMPPQTGVFKMPRSLGKGMEVLNGMLRAMTLARGVKMVLDRHTRIDVASLVRIGYESSMDWILGAMNGRKGYYRAKRTGRPPVTHDSAIGSIAPVVAFWGIAGAWLEGLPEGERRKVEIVKIDTQAARRSFGVEELMAIPKSRERMRARQAEKEMDKYEITKASVTIAVAARMEAEGFGKFVPKNHNASDALLFAWVGLDEAWLKASQ